MLIPRPLLPLSKVFSLPPPPPSTQSCPDTLLFHPPLLSYLQAKTVIQAEIDAAAELADFFRFNAKYALELEGEQPISAPPSTNSLVYRGLEVRVDTEASALILQDPGRTELRLFAFGRLKSRGGGGGPPVKAAPDNIFSGGGCDVFASPLSC